jgi:CRP-like cAMP-binding protein/CheY-like chemotaxis protein
MNSTILIIEDNQDMRENTAEILELANYKVITAENGKTGVEMAKMNKPDLILCDIMMPVLDGFGVMRALENIPEMVGIPFVFISAKAEKSDFRKGMDLGADDYFTKPFNGEDLLRIVSTRLKKNQMMKQIYEHNIDGLNDFMNTAKMKIGLKTLSDLRTIKKLRKKDMLFNEGDSPKFLYFVVSGKIKVFKSNEWGKDYIIDIHTEGDFLGYLPLLEESKYKEYAMAIENAEVALIPKQDFYQLLYSNNEVAMKFVKMLSNNFSEAEEKLLKLAYDSARKRVAEALIFVSKKYSKEGQNGLSFAFNRENISALSGISPESVSRNMTDFKDEGLIETLNGNINILNLKKLETLKN